ncbi:hypothetical protein SS50377_21728 [Spironucleus salmonicida]|uniref:Transmembrane protein n=1 Tax=Spironucleus salmonicida TaxID=348837 RepID=A0A9P8LXD7_9EUKA|nr:hypothetical protein SS50377_21728 [Spironucleus salmonicida]
MRDVGLEGVVSIFVLLQQTAIYQIRTFGMVQLWIGFAYVEIILLYSSWSKYSLDEFEISLSYHTQEYEIQLQGNFKVMVQQHVILLYLSIMLSEFENNQSMQN